MAVSPHPDRLTTPLPLFDALGQGLEPNTYWQRTESSYPHYPTVRHRRRFILNTIADRGLAPSDTIFDYGCGEATLLRELQQTHELSPERLAGCDISEYAIACAQERTGSPHFFVHSYPETDRTFDIIICSEVLEHTTEYRQSIAWMADHLAPNGLLILTTQTGKIHKSDIYTGHTQHFDRRELTDLVTNAGLDVTLSRTWGFPFFTIQKYATDRNFDDIREQYLEGGLSWKKFLVFQLAYVGYFLHDLVRFGPQVYLLARKGKNQAK